MKKSVKIIAIAIVGIITLYFGFIAYSGYTIKQNEAYKVAIAAIEKNTVIQSKTGGIIGYDTFPSGNISENEAVLLITVKGKNKDAKVVAMLTKLSGNQWRLYQMMNDFK